MHSCTHIHKLPFDLMFFAKIFGLYEPDRLVMTGSRVKLA